MELILMSLVAIYIIGVMITMFYDMSKRPQDVKNMFLNFWIIKYPWKWFVNDRIKRRIGW